MKIPRSQRSATYKREFFKPHSQFLSCTSKELQPTVHRSGKNLFIFPAIAFGLRISAALCDFFLAASSKIPEFYRKDCNTPQRTNMPFMHIFLHILTSVALFIFTFRLTKLFTFRLKIHHHKTLLMPHDF